MQYCSFITMRMSILRTLSLIALSKIFPYKSYTSVSSNISFFHFVISLVVESFWQLRFVQDLTKTHYWISKLTTLKFVMFFFLCTLACVMPTGHWACYWVCGLTLIFKVKYKDLSIRRNLDSKFY